MEPRLNTHLQEVARAAEAILTRAGALPAGWVILSADQETEGELPAVRFVLAPEDGGRGLLISWVEHRGALYRGFQVGQRYGASYLRGIDAWDVKDPATPEEVRQWAFAACRALGDAVDGPGLQGTASATEPTARTVPFSGEVVRQILSPHLEPGDELCDGWRWTSLLSPHPWEVHLLFDRAETPVTLRVVLTATGEGDPALRGLEIRPFPRMGIHRPWILESHESALVSALERVVCASSVGLWVGGAS